MGFAICGGILLFAIYAMLHVTNALTLMVDSFVTKFVEEPVVDEGIYVWNVTQAIVRHVSRTITACFVATHTTAYILFVFCVADMPRHGKLDSISDHLGTWLSSMIPACLMELLSFRLIMRASEVTSKCSRIPAFVNSLDLGCGSHIDHEREYMVNYMKSSAAGFYVADLYFTPEVAFKILYFASIGSLALMSAFSLSSTRQL